MSALERIANRGTSAMLQAVGNMAYASVCRTIGQRYVTKQIHDYKMILDLHDPGLSRALLLYGERELDHKIMLERYLKPGMRVFDIGGNIGYYPLMELNLMKGMGHLIVFEPVADNAALLRKNLALNYYNTVPVIDAAISDETTVKSFYRHDSSNLGTFHKAIGDHYEETLTACWSFRHAAAKFGNPDLVRMDIEGHEVEVLGDILHSNASPTIIFETHYDRYTADHDIAPVLHALYGKGYNFKLVSSASDIASKLIESRGYKPEARICTDATFRSLYRDIAIEDAIDFVCAKHGVRTVVLHKMANA